MITRFHILQALKIPLKANVFIISYQDEEVYQQAVKEICQQKQILASESMQIQQADQWINISQATQNYGFFQEPTCYQIELHKSALSAKSLPALTPLNDDVFIFKTDQFKHALLSKLAATDEICWINAYAPNSQDLWKWLLLTLKGYSLTSDIQPWFFQQSFINYGLCQQFIEKIQLSHLKPCRIDLQTFQNYLGIQTTEHWTPLLEAWMNQQVALSIVRLHQAKSCQQELTLLIWLLSRNVQVLYALKQNIQTPKAIFEQFKIWPKQIPPFEKFVKKLQLSQLDKLLLLVQELDSMVKSGQLNLTWLKLERFLLLPYLP